MVFLEEVVYALNKTCLLIKEVAYVQKFILR